MFWVGLCVGIVRYTVHHQIGSWNTWNLDGWVAVPSSTPRGQSLSEEILEGCCLLTYCKYSTEQHNIMVWWSNMFLPHGPVTDISLYVILLKAQSKSSAVKAKTVFFYSFDYSCWLLAQLCITTDPVFLSQYVKHVTVLQLTTMPTRCQSCITLCIGGHHPLHVKSSTLFD